ncbi:MAG: DUF5585 domain-containing protein [Anaerolineae bacterium]
MKRLPALLVVVALVAACLPQAGRAQSKSVMPLSAYPRPAGGNTRGIHWAPTLFAQPTEMVDRFVSEAQAMGMGWAKLMQGDAPKLEHEYLIGELRERGIVPILRVFKARNEPYQNLAELIRLGGQAGVSYYELYNEPNLSGESGGWAPGESISVTRMVDLWIPAAEAVSVAGGLPGLPSLSPGGDYDDNVFLREFLRELKSRGRLDLLYQAWLPLHNYFLNHPLDYPYDEVNLDSVPLSQDEIARRGLTADQVGRIDEARRNSRLPRSQGGYYVGDTIYADSNGFLKFQAYARILEEEVGFLIPIITTEGGAIIGSAEDPRYPAIGEDDLVEMTVGAFRYLEENQPAYYFAFCPWLMANRAGNSISAAWEGAAWYKPDGSTLAVVPALKALPPAQSSTARAVAVSTAQSTATTAPSPSAAVRGETVTLSVPVATATPGAPTPADATYPRPAAPPLAGATAQSQGVNAVVIASSSVEAWFLPDYGGRLIRLIDLQNGRDLLALPGALSPGSGSGAPRLGGGVAWLYPSPSIALVDDVPWQVAAEGSSASTLRLTVTEPRSRTDLTLAASVADDGSVTLVLTAVNPNRDARLVSIGVHDPTALFAASGLGDVVLPPGASHSWTLTRGGSTAATQPNLPAVVPTALATPIPYGTRQAQPTAAPTGAPTAAVATATPAASGASLDWDSRLDDLNVSLTVGSGAGWRLVEAAYEDETQSGGNHHIFVAFIDAGGNPCSAGGDLPWVAWPDGKQTIEIKESSGTYSAEFPMYGLLGAYSVGVGSSSDVVSGLGLPAKHHVNYRLTFQRQS